MLEVNIIKEEIKKLITEKYLTVYSRGDSCIELRVLFLHKAIDNHEGDMRLKDNLNLIKEYLEKNGFKLVEVEKWSVVESYLYKGVL